MADTIVRVEEWAGGCARRIERAIIMHATSRVREEGARLLAKIVQKSGARGAAFGWTDDLAPEVLAPVHAVTATPDVSWGGGHTTLIDLNDGFSWKLMVRGGDATELHRMASLVSFTTGWFADSRRRDCPGPSEGALSGPCSRFIELLDAYRFVGFLIGNVRDVPFFQAEFRAEIENMPTAVRASAKSVADAIADHCALSDAILDFGAALDIEGSLHEAVAVQMIGYELALLRCDGHAGIDAARWVGRAYRKLANWSAAFRWYRLAKRIAEFEEDWGRLAIVLDGTGNTHRERGAFPAARKSYQDAWQLALLSQDAVAIGSVGHSMMTVEREAGRLASAARHGWIAFEALSDREDQANLMLNIGTLLRDGGDVSAAEDSYRVVRTLSEDRSLRMMAADALAYCSALKHGAEYDRWRRISQIESRCSLPYLRAQIGYFRGASLRALGKEREAVRVLHAVERLSRSAGLSEWQVKAAELAERPLPQREPIETPAELRQGLKALLGVAL